MQSSLEQVRKVSQFERRAVKFDQVVQAAQSLFAEDARINITTVFIRMGASRSQLRNWERRGATPVIRSVIFNYQKMQRSLKTRTD
jgi:hypothetical protein